MEVLDQLPFSPPSLTMSVATAFAAMVAYIYILFIYRLTLHPLAKYPGPLLGKLTSFYGVYHAYIGDMHLDIERLHQKHGSFVRYGPNALLFGSVNGFHDIYDSGKNVKKSKSYVVHGKDNLLGIQDKSLYSRKKRIFNQAFSNPAIREHEPKVLQCVNEFCSKIANDPLSTNDNSGWSEPKDMSLWCNYLTLEIITKVVFTTSWNLLSSPQNRGVISTSAAIVHLIGIVHQSAWLYTYKILALILFPTLTKSMTGLRKYTLELMALSMEARKRDPDLKDVFGQLIAARDPESKNGEGLSEAAVRINSSNLLIAGSDTSSSALAATFFYLSRNKEAYEKVATEVRTVFTSSSEIRSGTGMSNCTYLRAAINEAMRLSPVVAQPLWREVEKGGASIAGQYIPAGINVGAGIYTLHHNSYIFSSPYTYDIERWVINEKKDAEKEKERIRECQRSFAPFSTGPRQCIAKNFAMMELMLTMAHVIWRMDFENVGVLGEGSKSMGLGRERKGEFQLESFFTSHMEGPTIKFRRRDGAMENICKV